MYRSETTFDRLAFLTIEQIVITENVLKKRKLGPFWKKTYSCDHTGSLIVFAISSADQTMLSPKNRFSKIG